MLRLALALVLLPLAACDFPAPPGLSELTGVVPDLSDGTLVRGTLADSDATRPYGQRRDDIATVTVPAGGRLEVMMESTDFDTYLVVELVSTDRMAEDVLADQVLGINRSVWNDDFNGSQARSVVVQSNPTDASVEARIVASTFVENGRGDYEVRYAVREEAPTQPAVTRALSPGRMDGTLSSASMKAPLTASGELRPANAYTLTLTEGTPVTFRMGASTFDPYLRLHDAARSVAFNDDFEGSRYVSQITYTPTATGPFTVYAGAFAADGAGDYTLTYTVGGDTRTVEEATTQPVASRPLAPGQTNGTIDIDSPTVPLTNNGDPRPGDAYAVRLTAGAPVTFRMESRTFDTYLHLYDGAASAAYSDDFEGSRSVSQITYTPPASGEYVLYAGAYAAEATGGYTLAYTPRAAPAPPTPTSTPAPTSTPPRGETVEGELTDADARFPLTAANDMRLADIYNVDLAAGETLTVVMESTAFDTYLKLMRGTATVARNDDDGSTRRSMIRYTATESGRYRVLAGTFHDRGRGAYTLTVGAE